MPGYKVTPETITKTGGELRNKTGEVDQIKQKAESAEVPTLAWGLLGAATTYGSYKDMLEKFKSHMEQIKEGIGKAGDSFTETGKAYQETDKQMADALSKISGQMSREV